MATIWFYNVPFHGHINPTLPLVRELVDRGDQVVYFSTGEFARRIQATGAQYRAYRDAAVFEATRSVSHIIHLGSLVAEATHALLPEVFAAVEAEHPDLLFFDMSAPWGNIASRRYRIPGVASFPHWPFYWRTVLGDRRVMRKGLESIRPGYGYWRSLRKETTRIARDFNLRSPRDINVLSSSAGLNIVFSTRYFQPYAEHFGDDYLYIGPTIETDRKEVPMIINKAPGQKLIYIAVGTVYQANQSFFQTCLRALSNPAYSVILSVGKAVDPSDLGPAPDNFTIAQYVPQLAVLEQADIFITHGGMNSINEAVIYGVPMVVVPNTIEQSINAARVEQLQAGIYLDPPHLTAERLLQSVETVSTGMDITMGLDHVKTSFGRAGGVRQAADAIWTYKEANGVA